MSVGLYSGVSGLALGIGLYRSVSGLWSGASGLIAGFDGYSPASIFAGGEQGAWYDPSDLTTMFQDTAGTTPVTAAGQSVALIRDKSGRGNHATQSTAGSRPTYQVDSSGFAYLSFDGSDDFLVTGTITPGIDKAQVFAGVRKLSDATQGMPVEFGTGTTGGISVNAPAANATANYRFSSAGSIQSDATSAASYPAPITSVLTGIGDIAADTCILRINGNQAATSATDQGTGNYAANALYIGRRGGTSLPFNGRLYSLILRFGANLTTAQITNAETWVNGKTGAYPSATTGASLTANFATADGVPTISVWSS